MILVGHSNDSSVSRSPALTDFPKNFDLYFNQFSWTSPEQKWDLLMHHIIIWTRAGPKETELGQILI